MPSDKIQESHQRVVEKYFSCIKDLRRGVEGAVDKLMALWHQDGIFEFAGSPPVVGTFTGYKAIHALYKNRFNSSGMKMTLVGEGKKTLAQRECALGIVDTEVHRSKTMESRIVAGWSTTIGTEDSRGFKVAGSHTFTFKDDKISSLKVVVSPRPDAVQNFSLEGLEVDDIGRLSLAAWMVV